MAKLVAVLQALGPLGAFVLAALDSAGVPLPTGVDALMVLIGAVSPGAAWLAAACAVVGSAAGTLVLFYLARKGGQAYLDRQKLSPRAARFRDWFRRYGLITVFIPNLLVIQLPTKVFVISAGALGVRPVPFLAVVLAARLPRYFGLAWLGTQLGDQTLPWLKQHAWHTAGIAVVLCAALYLLIRWAECRRRVSPSTGAPAR